MSYRRTATPIQMPTKTDFRSTILGRTLDLYRAPDITLREFVSKAWDVIDPANPLIPGWHTDYLCEYLSLVTEGEIRKLLINIPPRNGKSNLITIIWPVWSWIQRPSLRWIFCSYSASLSTKHSVDRRNIIESDWFQKNWGGVVHLSEDQNQKQEYSNTARGHMISTSVGGTITGKGGDVIVEDDMLNPQMAESEAERRASNNMHSHVLSNRLDNPKTGAKVLVEQRTHVDDVSGNILKKEDGWEHISLPLMFEKKTIITFPVSKREITREAGQFLNPLRQGKKEYDDSKRTMGTRAFIAQYQQNPTSDEGNIIRRGWWKFWRGRWQDLAIQHWIQSWDMNFKKTEKGSYVVGQVWGKKDARYFLIDQIRERMDFSDTLTAMIQLSAKWPQCTAKIIEDKANGPAIESQLKSQIDGIILQNPYGGKLSRAQAASPLVEAGNVFVPDPQMEGYGEWVPDFIEECAAFKGATGEVNDQVDSFSQAILRLRAVDLNVNEADEGGMDFIEEDYNLESAGGFSL